MRRSLQGRTRSGDFFVENMFSYHERRKPLLGANSMSIPVVYKPGWNGIILIPARSIAILDFHQVSGRLSKLWRGSQTEWRKDA